MEQTFHIHPIGVVRKADGAVWIDVAPRYAAGLLRLETFSHIEIFYWLDRNDTPQMRSTLQVHPRKDPTNPLSGVFATHSPQRPNLIAFYISQLIAMQGTRIRIDAIDALDGSPVIDIKCHIPRIPKEQKVRIPGWVNRDAAENS